MNPLSTSLSNHHLNTNHFHLDRRQQFHNLRSTTLLCQQQERCQSKNLLHLVPNLITKVDSLETELKQTKLTLGKAIVKLVKKVKKMEDILKRRHVVLTDSEDEEPEDQGRIIQDIDDDPLGSKGDFVTPTKPSGEA
ncbi:hypothetical protein Tco_0246405 [Tanacetum coccineum]